MNIKRMKTKRMNLSKGQQKVFDFISSYIQKYNYSPTIAEIANGMKKSSSRSITQYLSILSDKGLIARERYKTRSIRLINPNKKESFTISLPVFASAGCGNLSVIAERMFDEFIDISTNLIKGHKKENLYIIRAVGNSMIDAGINDGDLVLVERIPDQAVEIGDIVVALIEDNAVIKKYVRADDIIILNPVSPDKSFRPIIIDGNSTYKIFGKVLRTIRLPKVQDYQYVPA